MLNSVEACDFKFSSSFAGFLKCPFPSTTAVESDFSIMKGE